MKRVTALAVVLLSAVLGGTAATAPVAAAGTAIIRGTVHNATTDRPEAGVPIELVRIGPQGTEPAGRTRSDAAGRFAFAGLDAGRYLVSARHQGISYAAHAVIEAASAEVTVRVYDAAATVPLRMTLLGVAAEVRPGYARITEVVHLHNATTRTFLGDLAFPLPADARFVVFGDGLHRPRVTEAGIQDRLIVRPGGHQLTYQYAMRGAGTIGLHRRLPLPADRVELFVSAPAEARSPRLQPLPSVVEDGVVYSRASARDVPPGELLLEIAGVPSAGLWRAPLAAGVLAALLVAGLLAAVARAGS
ncbi:MAG: carboxypeptidase-like regulatory domain-containing protein [Armatimonadota bacterium]|nr:carboxypeptidase-like regulatory domain-containing protein [Armatimonadota bacterium]MDR7422792.1 carboxypeptidase-like regulatory domain-containing protein [Armatimonadota bacterium]MDR7453348.1 carboxypeptidase-like regulatory domain-containing protein [Armatimonadota bacterium]MDR7457034.1 carboxypeptidase-like regulatory domain-containing protein [Armatimonadota bacterium]MDR7497216.1 carboxypeptidase-like regulatory domain-containing protein [Armatimonadota bacterium]